MTNSEIKKAIDLSTRKTANFKIELVLWHGDGTFHDGFDVIHNDLTLLDENNNMIDCEVFLKSNLENEEIVKNEINLKMLRSEQNRLYKFLLKNYKNVTKEESTC